MWSCVGGTEGTQSVTRTAEIPGGGGPGLAEVRLRQEVEEGEGRGLRRSGMKVGEGSVGGTAQRIRDWLRQDPVGGGGGEGE